MSFINSKSAGRRWILFYHQQAPRDTHLDHGVSHLDPYLARHDLLPSCSELVPLIECVPILENGLDVEHAQEPLAFLVPVINRNVQCRVRRCQVAVRQPYRVSTHKAASSFQTGSPGPGLPNQAPCGSSALGVCDPSSFLPLPLPTASANAREIVPIPSPLVLLDR
jgi:hypothetical protein